MKKLKAFTLVELLVSIVIFGIIMAAVVQMITPINSGAVTAKVTNEQKNIENSITTYVGENVRYATNLMVVQGGTFQNAIDKFIAAQPVDVYGQPIDYTTYPALKNDIVVICFDGKSQYSFTNENYSGRLVRTKNSGPSYSLAGLPSANYSTACTPDNTGSVYEVFGNAYYSHGDYYMLAEFSDNALKLTVDSEYYYTPGAKKRAGGNKSNSSAANPIVGYYELRNKAAATPFIFQMVDSSGAAVTSIASTRTTGEYIYFVYTESE